MKNNLISEEEKNRILNLYEFYSKNMVGTKLITEIETIKSDKNWDYKESGNKYYARRKGTNKWVLATGEAERSIKKNIFKRKVKSLDVKNLPFKSVEQGNEFRKFVNNYYPKIAKKNDLSNIGPFDNKNIIKTASEVVKSETYGNITLKDLFFKQNKNVEEKGKEPGTTLPSLVADGFEIDKTSWEKNKGYYCYKCDEKGCAEYTYAMIGKKFGDAWQAYRNFNAYANVTPELVKKMTYVFNNINKVGMPSLNASSSNDNSAEIIIKSIIPDNQSQFNTLPLGTIVGLYYPDSSNFDLAFFQSATGRSRDNEGNWVQVRNPFFCREEDNCQNTLWTPDYVGESDYFRPNKMLKSGKSFIPNTHLGFIGYIDQNGERYVIHQIHQTVFAFPVSKMNKNTLSIIWAGDPKVS